MEPVDNTWKCRCGALNSFYRTLCGKCNKSQTTFNTKNMSYKIYNHTIQSNETVKSAIKKFRKDDNKNRKPQNNVHKKKRS
jgi:hypothetical protein